MSSKTRFENGAKGNSLMDYKVRKCPSGFVLTYLHTLYNIFLEHAQDLCTGNSLDMIYFYTLFHWSETGKDQTK